MEHEWLIFTLVSLFQIDLDVTLPSDEARERIFKVSLQYVARVSLGLLDQVLERKNQHPPIESIQALDVIMRHFPSIKLVSLLPLLRVSIECYGTEGWFVRVGV